MPDLGLLGPRLGNQRLADTPVHTPEQCDCPNVSVTVTQSGETT
ncbi:MAG: hypothetical protein ACRD1H_05175 [Vicinamibacterales bacterium]